MKYFGPFSFDEAPRALWRGGQSVPLTRKAANLLGCLIEARGGWMSKSAILSCVWPHTHVQPDNIKVLVHEIRQALQDDRRAPRFIGSESGRGYAFIAQVADETRSSELEARSAPIFVGRRRELDVLGGAWVTARRLIVVTGEPGIGKTALCRAFLQSVRETAGVRVLYGQSRHKSGVAEPFGAFVDALEDLSHIEPALVGRLLAEHAPDWLSYLPRLAPWNRSFMRSDGPAGHGMAEQLRQALVVLAEDAPVVIVLDDLHYADPATIAAVTTIAEGARAARLLLIATRRPGQWRVSRPLARLSAASHSEPWAAALKLGPLSGIHVAQFLDQRFGPDAVSTLAATLMETTHGHPALVSACAEGLVTDGVVSREAAGYQCAVPLAVVKASIEGTLRTVAETALAGLDGNDRRLLEAASCVGLEFTAESVAFVIRGEPIDVRRRLDRLSSRGQVVAWTSPAPAAGSARRDGYRFRDAISAELLAQSAPMFQQIHASERLASFRDPRFRRA
jgi:DNA-binding winged helix-turn-helix (wHTH) protein